MKRARTAVPSFLLGMATTQWLKAYRSYRREGRQQTAKERQLIEGVDRVTFQRHCDERVPAIEEEFELWGRFHQHRHEMRYDLVADVVRRHLPPGGRVLDVGAGAVLVGDRIADLGAEYVALEYGARNLLTAAKKFADRDDALRVRFVRGDGEHLPLRDESVDVLVMSEVIEHPHAPRPGGVGGGPRPSPRRRVRDDHQQRIRDAVHLAAPQPPLLGREGVGGDPSVTHLPAAVGWPYPVDEDLVPEGVGPVHLPHTHHIYEETRRLFTAAGLETFSWSTFEFPPPQSATDRWLESKGEPGKRVVDLIEVVARRLPMINRMGCHLFMHARKTGPPVAPEPPPGLWPGPATTAA